MIKNNSKSSSIRSTHSFNRFISRNKSLACTHDLTNVGKGINSHSKILPQINKQLLRITKTKRIL